MEDKSLWNTYRASLAGAIYTDLTHPFHPGQPHFPAFPDEVRKLFFDHEKGDGFQVHHYSFVGQWGTNNWILTPALPPQQVITALSTLCFHLTGGKLKSWPISTRFLKRVR